MIKKSDDDYNAEAAKLFKELSGGETLGGGVSSNISEANEGKYQLPIQEGRTESGDWDSLDKGTRPWIVGNFSPNAPTDKNHAFHNGVDLKAPRNTPVYPIAPGKVVVSHQEDEKAFVNKAGGGTIGSYVAILHEDGKVRSMYGHMLRVNVQTGAEVDSTTAIGTVGQSGNAYGRGDHLHYEVRVNNALVNPLSIVGKEIGKLSQAAELKSYIIRTAELFLLATESDIETKQSYIQNFLKLNPEALSDSSVVRTVKRSVNNLPDMAGEDPISIYVDLSIYELGSIKPILRLLKAMIDMINAYMKFVVTHRSVNNRNELVDIERNVFSSGVSYIDYNEFPDEFKVI